MIVLGGNVPVRTPGAVSAVNASAVRSAADRTGASERENAKRHENGSASKEPDDVHAAGDHGLTDV
jgi:hypothetical protein